MKRDAQLEKLLASTMKDVNMDLHESKDNEDKNVKSALLMAAAKMYRETKDDAYKTFVINTLNYIIENGNVTNVLSLMAGDALFFAYDETEDERYKNIICDLAKEYMAKNRNQDGILVDGDGSKATQLSDVYVALPFYMNYETRFGGKEHYSDVLNQYKAAHKACFCENCGLYSEESDFSVALYMASLINTMEATDQPVYEIFAGVKDIYKEALAGLLKGGKLETWQEDYVTAENLVEKLVLDYAIMKACRMKIVLTEKYEQFIEPLSQKTFAMVKEAGRDVLKKQNACLAAVMLAYAESTKERAYQVYGRNKGGALWS